jgi:hypothetical protein
MVINKIIKSRRLNDKLTSGTLASAGNLVLAEVVLVFALQMLILTKCGLQNRIGFSGYISERADFLVALNTSLACTSLAG